MIYKLKTKSSERPLKLYSQIFGDQRPILLVFRGTNSLPSETTSLYFFPKSKRLPKSTFMIIQLHEMASNLRNLETISLWPFIFGDIYFWKQFASGDHSSFGSHLLKFIFLATIFSSLLFGDQFLKFFWRPFRMHTSPLFPPRILGVKIFMKHVQITKNILENVFSIITETKKDLENKLCFCRKPPNTPFHYRDVHYSCQNPIC